MSTTAPPPLTPEQMAEFERELEALRELAAYPPSDAPSPPWLLTARSG